MAVPLLRRRFTVEEYHQMTEAGVFSENERVELIDGEIIEMAAIGSRHAACVMRLTYLFSQRLGARAIVNVQNPVQLGASSEPQPDVALLRPRADFYAPGHPQPPDVFLIVEVADSSVGFDRELKAPSTPGRESLRYGRAGPHGRSGDRRRDELRQSQSLRGYALCGAGRQGALSS